MFREHHYGFANGVPHREFVHHIWIQAGEIRHNDLVIEQMLDHLICDRTALCYLVRDEHLATLRAVLDHPGIAEAAAALGVHRNTVAYRVRRIEALTGWRLSDPDLRLPLALALRLVQSEQTPGRWERRLGS